MPELFKPLVQSKSRKPPAPKLLGELLVSIRESGDDVLFDAFQADPIELENFWPVDQQKKETLDEWMNIFGLNVLKAGENKNLEQEFGSFLGDNNDLEQWINVRNDLYIMIRNTQRYVNLLDLVFNYLQ